MKKFMKRCYHLLSFGQKDEGSPCAVHGIVDTVFSVSLKQRELCKAAASAYSNE